MRRREAESTLSLEEIAACPSAATRSFRNPEGSRLALRPYEVDDEERVAHFFDGLSPLTRHRYGVSDSGESVAQDWSGSIALYDKLRMVIEEVTPSGARGDRDSFRGIVEFSLDITDEDRERFGRHDILLDPPSTLRFGICLADEFQGLGVATAALPEVLALASKLGRRRIILWGGVLVQNGPAIAFYERNGFRTVGSWVNRKGHGCLDMVFDPGLGS